MGVEGRRAIVAVGEGLLEVREEPDRAPDEGEIRVRTLYSGISAGTELTVVKGTHPDLHRRWDPYLSAFVGGTAGTTYPVTSLGYMEAARVETSRAAGFAPGDVVAMTYGHRTAMTTRPGRDLVVPLPAAMDPVVGVFVAQLGPVCANALLHAAHELDPRPGLALGDGVRGRRVVVTGAGPIGLLTALFARHHGAAEVVVVDPTPARRTAAAGLGLDTLDPRGDASWRELKQRWWPGADLAIQCRGRSDSLALALRTLRPQGTVIDLAFYQGGAGDLRLGEEFHHNALTIRAAQIGRVPRGLEGVWDRRRLADATVDLLTAEGEAVRRHVVTDVVPFDDGPALLAALASGARSTVQAVLSVGGAA